MPDKNKIKQKGKRGKRCIFDISTQKFQANNKFRHGVYLEIYGFKAMIISFSTKSQARSLAKRISDKIKSQYVNLEYNDDIFDICEDLKNEDNNV